MEEKKTVKMGSEPAGRENEPTVLAGRQASPAPAPFVRTAAPDADQPTPRPGQQQPWQPAPPPPLPPAPPAWGAAQQAGPRADAATMMIAQRPIPVFAWLVVMDGPERGRVHTLKPETTVGRLAANDVVLPDDACSGQHLKIRMEAQEDGEDRFILIDLASRNGTYVGAKDTYRDPANRVYRHVLQDGDYLLLGETTLVFKRV